MTHTYSFPNLCAGLVIVLLSKNLAQYALYLCRTQNDTKYICTFTLWYNAAHKSPFYSMSHDYSDLFILF